MIYTLRMLKFDVNNEGNNEPLLLKKAMHYTDWPKWKDVIQVKYDSLI